MSPYITQNEIRSGLNIHPITYGINYNFLKAHQEPTSNQGDPLLVENPITRSATPETRTELGPSSFQREYDLNETTHSPNSSLSSLYEHGPFTSDIPGSDLELNKFRF